MLIGEKGGFHMGKKKVEHSVFEQMNRTKNSTPFGKVNSGKGSGGKPQSAKGVATQHRSVSHGNH